MTCPPPIERRWHGPSWMAFSLLAMAWAVAVLVRYHGRPLDPGALLAMFSQPESASGGLRLEVWGESLASIVLGLLTVAALTGLGRLLLDLGGLGTLRGVPVEFALGAAISSWIWAGLGFVGLWHPILLQTLGSALVLGGALFLARHFINRFLVKTGARVNDALFVKGPAGALVFVGVLILAVSMLEGLLPETFYDSMVYHLAIPAYWTACRGIVEQPINFFSQYPYGGELVLFNGFLWGPILGSQVAKLMNVAALALAAWTARDWVFEITSDRETALLAGFWMIGTPLLVMNVWSTQLEGLLCLYLLLFLRVFFEASLRGGAARAAWAGVLAGTALSMKYTAALGLGAAGLAALLAFRSRLAVGALARSVSFALVGVLPWVVRNAVVTGNPFHPYLGSLFGGRALYGPGYTRLLAEQREIHASKIGEWLALPWTLTMREPAGPFLLAFALLAVLYRIRSGSAKPLGAAVAVFFMGAIALTHHVRFLLTGYATAYVLLAILLAAAPLPWRRAVLWATLLSGMAGMVTLASVSRYYYPGGGVWAGVETRSSYLSRAGVAPYRDLAEWVNQNLPPRAVLLVVGDARTLYYERRTLANSVFDEQILPAAVKRGEDVEGILHRLRTLGITHLVLNAQEGIRSAADYRHYELAPDEWVRLEAFTARALEPLAFLSLRTVYRLRETPLPPGTRARPSLFPFLSRAGTDLVRSYTGRDTLETRLAVEAGLRSCPDLPFWWEQKARLEALAGREREALDFLVKAGERGVLQRENYRLWEDLLRRRGRTASASSVRETSGRWYPEAR